jgi:hypothetical protein
MGTNISKPISTDTIILDDAVITKLLTEKDELIKQGRAISGQIDEVQKEIDKYVEKEKKLTAKVDPKELIAQGEVLKNEINTKVKELEVVAEKIRAEKLKAIPEDMKKAHLALNDKREKLEKERNKIGLTVQKIKDRVVPKIQKKALKNLGEYEDLLTANVKDGKVVIEKFSHLQEWKRLWAEKHSK